jgi:menaquinone-dependent protoporphyrinogen oxidase
MMNAEKILVTYASRAGSTAEVAKAIGQTLREGGAQVDVRPMKEVEDLSPYRAVVAGSAIRGGKWLPEAMRFMHAHQVELTNRTCATFMVCITLGMRNGEKYRDGLRDWMAESRSLARPVSEGMFAGMLDFSKVPLTFNTLLMRLMVMIGVFPRGDHRDWGAIRTWAESLVPLLG